MLELKLENNEIIPLKGEENGFTITKEYFKEKLKDAIGYKINDEIYDMATAITKSGAFSLVLKTDKIAVDILNHSTSHLLAHAIKHLYKDVKFGFGPSIEEGFYYDFDFAQQISEQDFEKIEKEMKKIVKDDIKIVREEVSLENALELFKDNPYKVELIKELNGPIAIYRQGDFFDLCKGTHVPSTSYLKNFKLLSLAGAYWRGNSNNKQLTRIYGTSFFTKEDLENHLKILEERKLRDHRKLGRDLGLFMVSDYGPGFPFWLPNGMILRNELENYWYRKHTQEGYLFVKTPIMLSKELWETSGHWANYKENMYTSMVDDKEFAIKPMNCPGGMLVYKNSLHSYKDLPLRVGELGLVHRHEASGALNGLFRVRTFTQDDAHIFCREDQLQDEIIRMLRLYDDLYSIFGLSYHIELSTRPENKYIGDIRIWDKAEAILAKACKESGRAFIVNEGDGAFYGPKLDFKLKDSMNRIWQCGTIQLDMNLPERFDLTYIDEHGEKVRPIMLHRALFGSIERFIGIIIEHFGGAFPTWLAPNQITILPVNNQFHLEYANEILKKLEARNLRVKLDDSNEKLGYRMRNSQINKTPFTLVIGDKEKENGLVTYRKFKTNEQITVTFDEFVKMIQNQIDSFARIDI